MYWFILFILFCDVQSICNAHCQCYKRLKPTPCRQRSNMAVTYTGSAILVCPRGSRCGEVRYDALKWSFQNSFTSVNTGSSVKEGTPSGSPSAGSAAIGGFTNNGGGVTNNGDGHVDDLDDNGQREYVSDNDLCCETHLYSTHYSGQQKLNTAGDWCSIVYIPVTDQHQIITEGVCSGTSGMCPGVCQQMYTVHSIVAWNNSTETLGPELFEIPAYCACINTVL